MRPPIRWLPAGQITAFLDRRTIVGEVLAAIGLSRAADRGGRRLSFGLAAARREARWAV